jgi:hypothetical protein
MRYDIEVPEDTKHKQRGIFIIFIIILLISFSAKREANTQKYAQKVIVEDFDICLSRVCITWESISECLSLPNPMVSNIVVSKASYGNGKELKISPVGKECE